MMLTNFLPRGDGIYRIQAVAKDKEGNETSLGVKTIAVDNAHAVKPFGAIDTPTQGGEASGTSFRNHGWVLIPQPNHIPVDGSTLLVWIDGVAVDHPQYGYYRPDIASLFQGYANSNTGAGFYDINTTAYDNDLHTIQWSAEDSAGNVDGIGSRYFSIFNSGGETSNLKQELAALRIPGYRRLQSLEEIRRLPDHFEQIRFTKGYSRQAEPELVKSGPDGIALVEVKEMERIEINFGAGLTDSFLIVGRELEALPIGSTFDAALGIFYWQPGPGFFGDYEFVFVTAYYRKIPIRIKIKARF